MKRSLLVTLADGNYVDQAKQLFSGVYYNSGWRGDYMLLSHGIPEDELEWFEERGIIVRRCEPLYDNDFGGMPAALTSKFYLFTPEFRKWKNVVYLDADIIVMSSLEKLTQVSGFAAVPDTIGSNCIRLQMIGPKDIGKRGVSPQKYLRLRTAIKAGYGLRERTLCAGMFSFSTDIIREDTFRGLKALADAYGALSAYGDQLIFNLFFHRNWKKLPAVYNAYFPENTRWLTMYRRAAVLHFIERNKPWLERSDFYDEWRRNLEMADMINLKERPGGKRTCMLSMHTIYLHFLHWKIHAVSLRKRYSIYHITMGHAGRAMKRFSPRLYWRVKEFKDGVHDRFAG